MEFDEDATVEKDVSKCIEIYKSQLIQGDIRCAYVVLMKYMGELKAQFPKQYSTGNISFGYLDYTYFPFYDEYLRRRKLRFGIVLNHLDMRFELWLMGQNVSVQKAYWELLKNAEWNKNRGTMPLYSVLEVCLENTVNFDSRSLMTSRIINNAISLVEKIENFLMDFD